MIRSDWTEPHPLWIVGHRGSPRRARENTLDSFDHAEAEGADAIEFDLQQTRDGELVVFHDDAIPVGTDTHAIRAMASIDVRGLILESPFGEYRIPTLDDVFQRYGNALRYLIEVKVNAATDRGLAARRVTDAIAGFHLSARCLVASFDADFLRRLGDRNGGIAASYLFDRPVALPEPGQPRGIFPPCDAIGPRADFATETLIAGAARTGLSVHPWTIDAPEDIQAIAERGVASITTNDPELARRVLHAE
ncbi:MAG TPA: glycerophosphodiester phosphodiesterase [Thermoanaerobaculia bacterium]|nr:glycerophosphodiester phosphodiesterase [Thermoanaerobaculia bacterium]